MHIFSLIGLRWVFIYMLQLKHILPFPIPAPLGFLIFHCCLSVSFVFTVEKLMPNSCKACSFHVRDSMPTIFYAKQSMPRGVALVISLKMGTDNGNITAPEEEEWGASLCFCTRNLIRNEMLWSSISSYEMKGFEFVSLLAEGRFQSLCSFLSLALK